MNSYGCEWRWEKSKCVIINACFILRNTKEITTYSNNLIDPDDKIQDIRPWFFTVLYDATKLFCDALQEYHNDSRRWSPNLVEKIYQNPDRAEEILALIEQKGYVDNYWEEAESK